MMRPALLASLAMSTLLLTAGAARSAATFGALSNFDAVNDTGSPCNGFEIELDDIQSRDVTYTFQYQRYGVPKITDDTYLDAANVSHPRVFVRWMSPYDQVAHVFTQTTPVAPPNFQDTGGHLCFKNMTVNGQPYDTSGCEHFGVGTLKNPSATVYRWMKEDPTTPGSLVAQGSPVTIPAPVWSVGAGPNPVVQAVIPVPPPPAVVPVPYLPNAEFGVATWAKVFETESPEPGDLHHLVSDDPAVPGNLGGVQPPNTVTEIEWQILQTDTMNPGANELAVSKPLGNGNENVTRRYEFYKYVGPYDVNSADGAGTGTNEALCAKVGADGVHGDAKLVNLYDAAGRLTVVDCATLVVVGDYIGAQMAGVDVALPLSANGAQLADAEVGVRYPDRPLIFGGSGGPYSVEFSGAGTLPATDAGQEFVLDQTTGTLLGGIPNGAGLATFTVHATDLVDPAQPAVDATFNITVVPAVTVDPVAIPDGVVGVDTTVSLTASGGETPFTWSAVAASPGLVASITGGNDLVVRASTTGTFTVDVTVGDSLGGASTATLSYTVSGGLPTTTTTAPTTTTTTAPTTTTTAPTTTTTAPTTTTTTAVTTSTTSTSTTTLASTTSTTAATTTTSTVATTSTTLPACAPVTSAALTIDHIDPPSGDDKLTFKGVMQLTEPVAPVLDPVAHGLEIRLVDGASVVLDALVPAGAFDPATKVGWKVNDAATEWMFVGPKVGAVGGITKVMLAAKSKRAPGAVTFTIVGKDGAFSAGPGVVADVVLPDSGACFEAAFPATPPEHPSCVLKGATLKCK